MPGTGHRPWVVARPAHTDVWMPTLLAASQAPATLNEPSISAAAAATPTAPQKCPASHSTGKHSEAQTTVNLDMLPSWDVSINAWP